MEVPMVKLFMHRGKPTSFCLLLPIEVRKRMFRICRVLGKKEYNRMLRNWAYDDTVEVIRYDNRQVEGI